MPRPKPRRVHVDPIAKHGMPSDAAIRAAGEIYGAILADPERAEQIRAARAAAEKRKEAAE